MTIQSNAGALLEAALDCVILMDHEGGVVEFNPAAERTFGYRRSEALGREMAGLIIPPSLRDRHRAGLAHYVATGEGMLLGKRFEITGLRADGTEFPVELTITRLPGEGLPVFAGFLRDITERKLDESRLTAQQAVSRVLLEAESVEEMAARVLPAIGENLRWEVGALWRFDPEPCALRCAAVWHGPDVEASVFEAATCTARFAPGVGLPGRVWESREALWSADVLGLPNFPRCHAAHAAGLRAALAFPIRQGGEANEVLGVIEFFSRDTRAPDEELLGVVEVIGNEVGQFLRRKRLEEELRSAYERESKIAGWLQDALRPALPGPLPGLEVKSHYSPALQEASVGGDFFDVFTLEKGCTVLVVADLSGKGLAAAAQIATVRHMLRTLLYLPGRVSDAMTRLNHLLVEHRLLVGFATLFAGIYDAPERSLVYACCGQEPGLLHRAATGAIEELSPTGPVLGAVPDAIFAEGRVTLCPGDVLAVFTDGLTEAGARRSQLLGIEGVADLLRQRPSGASPSAAPIVSHLISGVEAFAGPGGIRDDVCLLVAVVEAPADGRRS